MTHVNGRKPPNPQHAPRGHGRKPPPPPRRTGRDMGKSSSNATVGQTVIAFAMFLAFPAGIAGGVTLYLLHGYGVI